MKPAKLVVVPGTVLGQLKVHLLSEDGEPKLVRVQLQLEVTPDDDHNGDVGDVEWDDVDDGCATLWQGERRSWELTLLACCSAPTPPGDHQRN